MSDIVSETLPNWHIECKGTKEAKLTKGRLLDWYQQIRRDSKGNLPVILHKANNKSLIAIMPLDVWEIIKPHNDTCYFGTNVEDSIEPACELRRIRDTVRLLYFAERMKFIQLVGLYYALELGGAGDILVFLDAADWLHCITQVPSQP